MKWKEKTAAQKVFTVLFCVFGFLIFLFAILAEVNVLPAGHDIEQFFAGFAWLCFGFMYWKQQRGMAITWFILGGLTLLLAILKFI